ncbi:SurA N-terminal domain-containing protein [Leucothrix mucor]|uniref:SurA N-terminal domain-containing protein n=1 Tax=Leucothrix mucor TaxID=45248 RepID=UPI0003B762FE|nr:SurA N-terminal domain-containing protein [Leucothrix mucor]
MLQTINDKAKGWVAYAIVIFISIPFMLFGIGSYLDGNEKVVAATVNGEDIEIASVTTAALQQKQRLTSIYGSLPPQLDDKTIKEQVLNDLVNRELLKQSVEEYGYRASSQEVADMIRGMPSFQKDGQFDETTYQQLLQANRLSPTLFEQQTRDDLTLQQMTSSIADTSFVPKQQAELYQSLLNQERSGKVYSLRVENYTDQVTPDADKVKAFYESNPALFESAERVKLRYLLVDRAQLASNLEVDDEKLAAYFEENANLYRQAEQRKISHILIRTAAEDDAAAKARAEELHARIISGEKTFEELATTDSDDTIAAEKAGDMGFMQLNQMSAAQATAAAALKVGEVSEPVLTDAGYEIIKLFDVKEEVIPEYEAVKAKVDADYRNSQAEKVFIDHVEKLQTLSFENDSSLEPAADALGAEVTTSEWITRSGGAGLGQQAAVREAAFSDDVMNNRRNSSLIEISPTEAVVVRLEVHEDASVKPFAEVEKQATDAYIDSESRKLTRESGEALLAELQKTADWSALEGIAELNPADIETFEQLKRNDRKLSPQVVSEIFKLSPADAEGKVSFASTILPNGDFSLIGLDKVVDGDTEVSNGGLNSFKEELSRREQDALIKAMREQAEVIVNDSALE